jgi:hypothetical protein
MRSTQDTTYKRTALCVPRFGINNIILYCVYVLNIVWQYEISEFPWIVWCPKPSIYCIDAIEKNNIFNDLRPFLPTQVYIFRKFVQYYCSHTLIIEYCVRLFFFNIAMPQPLKLILRFILLLLFRWT